MPFVVDASVALKWFFADEDDQNRQLASPMKLDVLTVACAGTGPEDPERGARKRGVDFHGNSQIDEAVLSVTVASWRKVALVIAKAQDTLGTIFRRAMLD